MQYEPTIGIEAHAQLITSSKVFCACRAQADAPANSLLCPVCLGLPGALPVVNQRAVELAVKVAIALHCQINPCTRFDRNNHAYRTCPRATRCRSTLTRWAGLAGCNCARTAGHSLIDLDRAGIPLLEIVTRPDLHSAEEAHLWAVELRRGLAYLGACTGDMEKGALRFEANVSLHQEGSPEAGTRVEVKNLNSLRALKRSIEFELGRQGTLLQQGLSVSRETRGWDEAGQCTVVQRSKESAVEPSRPLGVSPKAVANWMTGELFHLGARPPGRRSHAQFLQTSWLMSSPCSRRAV